MREIRFRAWDKKNKIMLTEVGVMDNKAVKLEDGEWGELLFFSGLIIMQYTGLSDKNGKEIYEGDIIKIKENHEVVFRGGCFMILNFPVSFYRKNDIEVIGNVWENPELLKSKEEIFSNIKKCITR